MGFLDRMRCHELLHSKPSLAHACWLFSCRSSPLVLSKYPNNVGFVHRQHTGNVINCPVLSLSQLRLIVHYVRGLQVNEMFA